MALHVVDGGRTDWQAIDSMQRATNTRDEPVILDREELRRRQLGLDRYPRVRSSDLMALAFASLAFAVLWVWCKLTGKKPEEIA
jgi:hypothetical protein